MRISYSSFDTFNRCPLQYKFSYIDRIKTPEKPELYFGSLIHEIVQFALRRDPVIPEFQELSKMLKNRWRKNIFASDVEADQYFKLGEKMLREFYDNFKPGLRNIVSTEKRFLVPLSEKHVLSGVIDRIDQLPIGDFEVIDYKTSKSLPSQMDVDKDKQLGAYSFAIQSLWPDVKNVRLTLYFLKFNAQLSTKRNPEEVEQIKEEIIKTADKIESAKDFAPKLNPLCGWCGYKEMCPLQREKIKKEERKIDQDIEEYILAREKISAVEPKIHQHFDAEKIENYTHPRGQITRDENKNLTVT